MAVWVLDGELRKLFALLNVIRGDISFVFCHAGKESVFVDIGLKLACS
jgi:hypothetical protein